MIRLVKFAAWQIIIAGIIIFQFSCKKSGTDSQNTNPPPPNPPVTKKWVVSTFAGSGQPGSTDAKGTQAEFYKPKRTATDSKGNIYVTDGDNFQLVIRKIDSSGNVSTYEGSTVSSGLPWVGLLSIAFDNQDNLYAINDYTIYKIIGPHNVSVFAGGRGYVDGHGTDAKFNFIGYLAGSPSGNIYLADYDLTNQHRIRMMTPDADVSTINLTDNTGYDDSVHNFLYIFPITVDQSGNLYITSNGSNLIKKIDPQGIATVFAGQDPGFKDGKGTAAQFQGITGLAADNSGNIFVTEVGNNAIRKITPDGTVTTIAGTGDGGYLDGDGSAAKFDYPFHLSVTKNGVVYVADYNNNRIRKIEYK